MRAKPILVVIPALALLAGCEFEDMGGFGRYQEDFHYSHPLKTGGRVAVESFNGSIEVSPWDQETVDISGTKYGRSPEDAASIHIDIDRTADSISIRARRPIPRVGNQGARFVLKVPRSAVLDRLVTSNGAIRANDAVGPGRFHSSNGGIHVMNYRGDLDLETSNSAIELTNVEGSITGHTSNGSIRCDGLRGMADLSTSNSAVRIKFDRVDGEVKLGSSNGPIELTMPGGPLPAIRAHTSNSGITVHLAAESDARIEASTSNGSITSDFEMRLHGSFGKHHLSGVLGNGGALMDLSTSNGSVRIVR
jgi:uncharacterized protein involved in outer membrane biogenesis